MKYFKGSIIFTVLAILFAGIVGSFSGGIVMALGSMLSAIILGVLETSVSLDNAVVNAKYLEKMNNESRHWFLTWGMVIAVFGMRLILPIIIVCIASWVNPLEAIHMALLKPEEYQKALESVHVAIMGFGAGFLLMVCLEYFFNSEKETHWIPGLEKFAAFVGKFPQVDLLLGIPVVLTVSYLAPHDNQALLYSSFGGLLTFYFIHGVKELLEALEEEKAANMVSSSVGLMVGSLIFLEILDASFSFDGVIAAFAITNKFLIIAAGLGIGAMFVRSLTIFLVDEGTMSELKYLENGAFVGIAWLVFAMYMSAYGIELGEVIVAGGAAGVILLAGFHSWKVREAEEEA